MTKRGRKRKQPPKLNGVSGCVVLILIAVIGVAFIAYMNSEKPLASTKSSANPAPISQPTIKREPTARPTSKPSTSSSQSYTCPSNCTQAKAMGLTAQQAAACGLDRDGDGKACYGD